MWCTRSLPPTTRSLPSGPPAPPASSRSPSRGCARTRSLLPRRGTRVRVWVRLRADGRTTGTLCLRTRRSKARASSPLHWQDEPALAEAESRLTSVDTSPYGASNDGYGVDRSESMGSAAVAGTPPMAAPPVYGVEYAEYARGARGEGVYDPDSVYDARGSTLLAYDRDSACRVAKTRTRTPH
ncbi:hypothetical protein B0H13DRAFT_797119 [Mycena leptocephala]|nr:hypothetical protein B0H13DRAFT_797119 [Mycena leptocephala]